MHKWWYKRSFRDVHKWQNFGYQKTFLRYMAGRPNVHMAELQVSENISETNGNQGNLMRTWQNFRSHRKLARRPDVHMAGKKKCRRIKNT